MIINLKSRALSITYDESSKPYRVRTKLRFELAARQVDTRYRRCVVELRQYQGGMIPHVMVGGSYEPGGEKIFLEIGVAQSLPRRREFKSVLGRRLVPGLTEEFVEPVLGGLSRTVATGPGVISIDKFAWDPVETSLLVVELAAELVGRILSEREPPSEALASAWLTALP